MRKKHLLRRVMALSLAMTMMAAVPFSAANAQAAWGWDAASGRLAVDYETYLSKHDLVYTALPTNGETEGMPVANGKAGAQVWQDDGIRMQIHSVDNAPHSAFSAAQVRLSTAPTLNDKKGFEQRLHLYDGHISIAQNDGFTAEIFGLPNSETMAIHVKDARKDVRLVSFDVEMWNNADSVITASGTTDTTAWKTIDYFEEQGIVGFTKGISKVEPFGYAFAATVEGAEFDIVRLDDLTARIYITLPESGEYTVWMNASSRVYLEEELAGGYESTVYSSTAEEVFAEAVSALQSATALGTDAGKAQSKAWWNAYWQSSFVSYENTNAAESDYLENFYYLAQYQLGGGAFGLYPQQFMRGVFNASKDTDIKWNNGYWHFNQRAVYHGMLASNHVEGYLPYLNFYNGIQDTLTAFSLMKYTTAQDVEHGFISDGVTDAMKTTETVRWDGFSGPEDDSYSSYNNDYTGRIFSTGSEVAENMYYAYKYTMDEGLLEQYYEYIRRTVRFITEWARWDEESGLYHLDYSNALENWWYVNNSAVDNAAVRSVIPKYLEATELLGMEEQDAALIAKAKDVLEKLEPATMTKTDDGLDRYAAYDINDYTVTKTNYQNPELEIVYPHNLVGIDHEDLQIAINTYNERSKNTTKDYIWCVDGIQEARLGLGDAAEEQMGNMIRQKQSRPSGFTNDGNGKLETMGLHISTMNEMLLQSYDDVIRVFPAVPSDEAFKGAFTLLASGGFLVSSEYADQAVRYVGLLSQKGGKATVKCPWADAEEVLVNGIKTAVADGRIVMDTVAGESYLIQPLADESASYQTVSYTATANDGTKQAFEQTLGYDGTGTRGGKVAVFYDFNDEISDGAFTDAISGNAAVIKGSGVTRVQRSEGDYAVSFNGSGYLEIETSDTFDPMENYVFSFDMNSTTTANNAVIFDKYGSSQGFYVDLYKQKMRVLVGSKVVLNVAASELLDGNWHTVKVEMNTAEAKATLWYDGVQKGTATYSGTAAYTTQVGRIAMSRETKYPYVGLLDNVKLTQIGAEDVVTVQPTDDLYAVSYNEPYAAVWPGVLANDINDATGLSAAVVEDVQNGTLKFFGDGAFVYTPDTDFVGEDHFIYQVYNKNNEIVGTAAVTLQVAMAAETADDDWQIFYGESLQGSVVANDTAGNGAALENGSYQVVFLPTEGQDTCPITLNEDGSFTYTAEALPTAAGFYYDPILTFQYQVKMTVDGVETVSEPATVVIHVTRDTEASVYYGFGQAIEDGMIADESGKGNDAVAGGTVAISESGTLLFDGEGYLQIAHSDTMDLRDEFEISMKIKADASRNQVIFDKSNVPGTHVTRGLYMDINNGNIRLFDRSQLLNVACPFTTDRFTELRLVYSTSEGKVSLYFDGELVASAAVSEPVAYVNSYMVVGQRLKDSGLRLIGEIDDFRIQALQAQVDNTHDLNSDGAVNTADVVALLQYLNGNATINTESADLNGDGKISLADALQLLKKIAQ